MGSDQFSLCWDNFHKNMSAGMQSLLENEDLVDVTLAVEGRHLKAHKMVLSVCSPYFRELFQTNPCKHPIVFMKDVSYVAMSDLLQFMYQGEVQVSQDNLSAFIKTAEALQIKGLTGDNGATNDAELSETEVEKPQVLENAKRQRDLNEVSSTEVRKAAPTPKRQKMTAPAQHTVVVKEAAPIESFKVEAFDEMENSALETVEDDPGDAYEDDNEANMDETEDYALIENADEPKAGPSGDNAEGQDVKLSIGAEQFVITENFDVAGDSKNGRRSTRTRYVVNGFVYHNKLVSGSPPMRYMVCADMKRCGCRARAIMPMAKNVGGFRVTTPHNHPPNNNATERESFVIHLKKAVAVLPGTMKAIYENVAMSYPNAASELSFRSLCSSMHRWRKSSSYASSVTLLDK